MVLIALSEEKHGIALKQKYQLKDAIMRLGIEGFLFENYAGKILEETGFKIAKIRSKTRGKCAIHEIDLVVFSNDERILVECKYHSKHGAYTGLKESLYTHARFLDTQPYFDSEYLICNTKVSTNAKKYAKCVGQKILSWRYPPKNSLENIIEKNNLYPITILNITSKELEIFSNLKIILAKQILDYDSDYLSAKTKISLIRIRNFQKLVKQIIQNF